MHGKAKCRQNAQGLQIHCTSIYSIRDIYIIYCMKPPKIKAPNCTLFSIQCFIFQGKRSQGLTGLATAPCEHIIIHV